MSELPVAQAADTSYCFKWSNYQGHLSEVVRQLLDEECMVDVTLYSQGERIQAHRLVLCACSTLFQEILSQVNDEHPTIILSDISPQDVRSIVEFSYNGEVRIPVENINNLLDAAHSLKICGLMEIEGLDETEIPNDKDDDVEETYILNELTPSNDDEVELIEKIDDEKVTEIKRKRVKNSDDDYDGGNYDKKVKKQRRSVCKKEYTDEMLANAIADIRAGKSLLEAASQNQIPRSTLYMRAKILGIHLNPVRSEYTYEDVRAAIQAVCDGSSLQQASDCYGIPKTVLWRRIQKEGISTPRRETRKNYAYEKREAAVKALAKGESLTKVANEYKIPKTTLFRDKVRLVDQGKLPLSFWKKRKTDTEEEKRSRLEEAVAACKDGKMSQALASTTYQIPKTTIWRRLHQDERKVIPSPLSKKRELKKEIESPIKTKAESVKSEELNEGDFEAYCPDESEMSITYIDESNMTDDPVIILTSGDVDNLDRSLVVVQSDGNDDNFISCGLEELDENSAFESKS